MCIWFIDCELFISIFQVGNYHQQTIMNATSYSNNLWTNQVWPIPGQSKSSYFRHSQSEWRNSIHPIGVEYFVSTWKANSTVYCFIIFSKRTRPNSLFWSFKRSGLDCESTHRQRMNFIYVESKAKLLSSWLLRSYRVLCLSYGISIYSKFYNIE